MKYPGDTEEEAVISGGIQVSDWVKSSTNPRILVNSQACLTTHSLNENL